MNPLVGSPALALLLRLKLRGLVRKHGRRLRTPKGLVLTLLGCAAFALWLGGLAFSFARPAELLTGPEGALRVRAFALLLVVLSFSSALTNRGLYLPRAEIERLFSAPLARAELVRYRLLAGGLRSLIGGLVLGLFGARRMPEPLLAFLGIVLAMQTLPVLNQLVAIALGGLEQRAADVLRRVGSLLVLALLLLLAALVFALVTDRPLEALPGIGPWLGSAVDVEGELLAHPYLARATLVFVPWSELITADSLRAFAPWFVACVALHLFLVELCARLPIDYRETALATSARAAARMARVRRGGGAAATRASRTAARWRIPWLFGRGPAGAIAWRKCAGMVRKAKGAFWVALIALLFITVFANLMLGSPPDGQELGMPVLIAMLGTIYLCSGLRFDFREELERMDVIRAWPLSPARVFAAMLLPEVVLVSLLVGGTVLLESGLAGRLGGVALAVVAFLPFLVFAWVAADNLVFLFAPVRSVPGQDGFVQNTGRRMLQLGLFLLVLLVLLGFAGLAFAGCTLLLHTWLALPERAAFVASGVAALAVLAAGDLLLVRLGGAVLRRFDVARDRG